MSLESTTQKVLALLKKNNYQPDDIDEDNISFWIKYFEMEPIALSEKLAEETGLSREEIFNIL